MDSVNNRSNVSTMNETNARNLLYSYFRDWSPDLVFIQKMVNIIPKDKLEELVNDKHLKVLYGLNRDEKIVLD